MEKWQELLEGQHQGGRHQMPIKKHSTIKTHLRMLLAVKTCNVLFRKPGPNTWR